MAAKINVALDQLDVLFSLCAVLYISQLSFDFFFPVCVQSL